MSITIASFDGADRASVDEAYLIGAAVNDADLPDFPPFCRRRFDAMFHTPMPGTRSLWALARLDGVPAGYLQLDLPQLDNTDNATAELVVHPELRRRGVGRALHEYGVRLLREHGRKRVVAMTVRALPAGPARSVAGDAFAASTGAQSALAEVRRRLEVAEIDRVALRAALAEARPRAEGYQSVCWQGATPQEYVADIAYLDSRLMMDAPMGDVQWEPEQVDAERIRGNERALDARGRRRYHLGMRHEASGRLVAWTLLDVGASADWHAFQQITLVDPAHRGRRLGLIAKAENLHHLLTHEPAVRVIDTWNAASNSYMVAINEQLGFRPVDSWNNWQLTL
ncbi:GNAT family N-acetyltransferase [Micromonospora parathelypteridis]|uniref:GNAT superfamily N-acetyltransferase n=1 Tax=Micromonospora parathelypteridis TaxID=1839617 RepID=A0A840VMH8_9ACTN|nr:GNAT family N-acetyltransferase [Micromonospora parathelypteridis]MBB5477875.1 GNAT superfamily N-acetyltransferase [Micromonospora parathelypteridis]GGO12089.1 GNAT family N-acetyltransferase [Micromonospora parathelypteridis]